MPRPILTPEERKQRAHDKWQRWYARNKEKQRARERARYHTNRAAMTADELENFNARHAESSQRYRNGHREEVNAKARAHYHRPEIKARENARDKAQREADPDFWRAYHQAARQRNHATHIAASKRWHTRHPEAAVLAVNKRRARKMAAPRNDLTHQQWLDIQAAQDHCCAYCGKRCKGRLTQDHITPLSQGGSHTLHNVIGACRACNATKHTGPPLTPVQPLLL